MAYARLRPLADEYEGTWNRRAALRRLLGAIIVARGDRGVLGGVSGGTMAKFDPSSGRFVWKGGYFHDNWQFDFGDYDRNAGSRADFPRLASASSE